MMDPQPQQQGLFGRLGGALGQVFGGMHDPSLTEEQNQDAQRRALMRAGMSGMALNGQGASTGQVLGHMGVTGQDFGDQMRGQMSEQNAMQAAEAQRRQVMAQLQEALGGEELSRENLQRLMFQAMLSPDPEMQAMIPTLKEIVSSIPESTVATYVDPLSGDLVMYDNKTGAELRRMEGFREYKHRDVGNRIEYYDPRDPGTVVFSTPKGMAPGAGMMQNFQMEQTLAQAYYQQNTRQFETADAYGRLLAGARTGGWAGDSAMLSAIIRMYDPNLRPNEGMQLTQANAGGIPDAIRGLWNTHVLGRRRMEESTRQGILAAGRSIAQANREELQRSAGFFGGRARDFGLDPERILQDPFDQYLRDQAPSGGPRREPEPDPEELGIFGSAVPNFMRRDR